MSKTMEKGTGTVRRGSCLCQAVKYEIQDGPVVMRVCHCVNCRKATGSAFMSNGFFMRHQVRVVQGEEKLKVYRDKDTASGVPLDRQFCTECGSNVFLATTNPELGRTFIIIALGTLDDEMSWLPKTESFVEQRRHWVVGIRGPVPKPKPKL